MAKISDLDVLDIRQFFEDALNQAQRADRRQKMRMRRRIRDEVFNLLTWEKPTPTAIMNRWEERLNDVLKVMPFGFREELFKLLVDRMQHPLQRQNPQITRSPQKSTMRFYDLTPTDLTRLCKSYLRLGTY